MTNAQKQKLMELVRENKCLSQTGKFRSPNYRTERRETWGRIGEELNAMGGAKKKWNGWLKVSTYT